MVSTRKKKHQHKRQLSQLSETLNDFVIRNHTNSNVIGDEFLGFRINSFYNLFGRTTVYENSAFQDQFVEKDIDDKIIQAVDNAVIAVENRVHDAILTAMHNVVLPRVEMAVISITESSERVLNSVV